MTDTDLLWEARATIQRLNARAQLAESAVADSKRVIAELIRGSGKGTPWCGGSLGRAFLAYENAKLRDEVAELKKRLGEGTS